MQCFPFSCSIWPQTQVLHNQVLNTKCFVTSLNSKVSEKMSRLKSRLFQKKSKCMNIEQAWGDCEHKVLVLYISVSSSLSLSLSARAEIVFCQAMTYNWALPNVPHPSLYQEMLNVKCRVQIVLSLWCYLLFEQKGIEWHIYMLVLKTLFYKFPLFCFLLTQ